MEKLSLGIELGSTTIKAVLIDENFEILAQGNTIWESKLTDGNWTYSTCEILSGISSSFSKLKISYEEKTSKKLVFIDNIGVSAMMHGYLAFDSEDNLLTPFRTWRNCNTKHASKDLTEKFEFNIAERFSVAHLYQAILNKEEHVSKISFMTTLSGYVHYLLTGQKVLGIGDASGMFPVDFDTKTYDEKLKEKFYAMSNGIKIDDIFPKVLVAGGGNSVLTKAGAKILDKLGELQAGSVMCPPEGDAGTGMVATNSIRKKTANISAGTSIFGMVVLEKRLTKVYENIDVVTTPTGDYVAMVHCNNCTSDLNGWVMIFKQALELFGVDVSDNEIFTKFFNEALNGDFDCGGLLSYNYLSGEHASNIKNGVPFFMRSPNDSFTFANFMRTHLFSAISTLKIGFDLLILNENVQIDSVLGHGGFYKTKNVGQKITAMALNRPVSVMETASNGGAYGIALLASFMNEKCEFDEFLVQKVFVKNQKHTTVATKDEVSGFADFHEKYTANLDIMKFISDKIEVDLC